MLKDIFIVFWFFAPAGFANVCAFASGKIPWVKNFSYPIDFYKKFRGNRILGDHKTFRGFIFAIIGSVCIVYLQTLLYNNFVFLRQISSFNYNTINPFLFGFLSGFGALAGDSIKSFFKRQMNIPPGKSWVPFDQIDYILGGLLFTSLYIRLSFYQYLLLFFLWFLLHPIVTLIGWLMKLKEEPL
jgi:CDP-2,3-bis-(O-geranylgeranyl)-sn-glycerol synthase